MKFFDAIIEDIYKTKQFGLIVRDNTKTDKKFIDDYTMFILLWITFDGKLLPMFMTMPEFGLYCKTHFESSIGSTDNAKQYKEYYTTCFGNRKLGELYTSDDGYVEVVVRCGTKHCLLHIPQSKFHNRIMKRSSYMGDKITESHDNNRNDYKPYIAIDNSKYSSLILYDYNGHYKYYIRKFISKQSSIIRMLKLESTSGNLSDIEVQNIYYFRTKYPKFYMVLDSKIPLWLKLYDKLFGFL